jgi:carbonic anhydrase
MKKLSLNFLALLLTAFIISCGGDKEKELQKEKEDAILVKEVMTKSRLEKLSAKAILELLEKGNIRFYEGFPTERDYVEQAGKLKDNQYPHTALVSCIDSRIPTEIIFDCGIGDIMSFRSPAAYLDQSLIGGLELATKVKGCKLILVMGNSNSPVVKAVLNNSEIPNLSNVTKELKEASLTVGSDGEERSANNEEFISQISKRFVLLQMKKITDNSNIIKEMVASGKLLIVGGLYNTETGRVIFFDEKNAKITQVKPSDFQKDSTANDGHEKDGEHKGEAHGESHGGGH